MARATDLGFESQEEFHELLPLEQLLELLAVTNKLVDSEEAFTDLTLFRERLWEELQLANSSITSEQFDKIYDRWLKFELGRAPANGVN